jgi:hypothetical protein
MIASANAPPPVVFAMKLKPPKEYKLAAANTVGTNPFAITCTKSRIPPPSLKCSSTRLFTSLCTFVTADPLKKKNAKVKPNRTPEKIVATPTSDADTAPDKSSDFFLYPLNANRRPKQTLPDARFNKGGIIEREDGSCAKRIDHPATTRTQLSFRTLFKRTLFATKLNFFFGADGPSKGKENIAAASPELLSALV